ncbi:hypothetical protein DQ04_01171110 [Trypanosoma grayi]|uniref:hypothetical protein n=1 Tax=Trypanosoma grayi TaxID=71804 RepID=UPI0004F45882|nr:hypothetical protein DQ04_01171110 [Trypanosoma grayi]KEG13178.1 hypothetical protein DQ04_01171110 [Trypanosoma grayi]
MLSGGSAVDIVSQRMEAAIRSSDGVGEGDNSCIVRVPQQDFLVALARLIQGSLKARFTEEEKEMQKRLEELKLQRERVCHLLDDLQLADAFVSFNVGGTIFAATRRTLCAVPESMLAVLMGEWLPVERDASGAIFLDRSPHLFREILSYLRLKADHQRERRECARELEKAMDEDIDGTIMAQLAQTSWRHMTSRQLHAVAVEANYYNLKSLEHYLVLYCQRRWIECGSFVASSEGNDSGGGGINSQSLSTGAELSDDAVLCIAYDEESGVCAVGRVSAVVAVYLLPSMARLETLCGHTDSVTGVVVTPKRIFSSSRDGFIHAWHSREGSFAPICSFKAHQSFVHDLLLLREKETLLSGGEDHAISAWSFLEGSSPVITVSVVTPGPVRCLAAYHGYTFAACRGEIVVLDVVRGELLPQRGKAHSAPIRSLAVDERSGLLASGGWDGALYVWDAKEAVTSNKNNVEKAAENSFAPLYVVAQCDSLVMHVSFVGGLLAASCGSTMYFFECGLMPRVVRCIKGSGDKGCIGDNQDELVRVFLTVERVNCLLVGGLEGTFTALHNRIFPDGVEVAEKGCQWEGNSSFAFI